MMKINRYNIPDDISPDTLRETAVTLLSSALPFPDDKNMVIAIGGGVQHITLPR